MEIALIMISGIAFVLMCVVTCIYGLSRRESASDRYTSSSLVDMMDQVDEKEAK